MRENGRKWIAIGGSVIFVPLAMWLLYRLGEPQTVWMAGLFGL